MCRFLVSLQLQLCRPPGGRKAPDTGMFDPLPFSAVEPTPAFAKAEAEVQPKSLISAFAASVYAADADDADEPNPDEPNPAEASSSSGANAVSVDATDQPEFGEVRCEWSSAPRGLDL